MIELVRTILRGFGADRAALVLAFAAPLAFFTMFALFFRHLDGPEGVALDVVVVCPERSPDAERFLHALSSRPHGRMRLHGDAASVPDGKAEASIEVLPGFSAASPRLAVRSEFPLPGAADAVRELACAAALQAFGGAVPVEVEDRTRGGSLLAGSAGGVAVMFALFSCSSLALRGLADEGAGFRDRLRSLRVDSVRRVAARTVALATVAFLQLTLTFAFAAAAFGVVPASPIALAAACAVSAVALAATVVAVAAACGNRSRFASVSPVVTLALSGLGGSMVPLALLPAYLAWPSRYLVSAWAIESCSGAVGTSPPAAGLALLVGWSVAMVAVASVLERRSDA